MTLKTTDLDTASVVRDAIEKHGATPESLIPILSEVNRAFGYVPAGALKEMKRQIHLPQQEMFVFESQLFSTASFYHMLSTKPLGKHVVRFCESAPCHVVGGRELFKKVKDFLQLKPGETTANKKWSLITTSCLGICSVGPVMLVDDDLYSNVTPDQVPEILARYE